MKYSDCPLYGLQSKKMLKRLLHIEDSKFTKQDYIASLVSPYIDKTGKPRLIEPPHKDLKTIQKRLKNLLGTIVVPNNIFRVSKGVLMRTMQKCTPVVIVETYLRLI